MTTIDSQYPYFLANQAHQPNLDLPVRDKHTGEVVSNVALADAVAIETAITAAHDACEAMRAMPAHKRQSILNHCVQRFQERFDEFADILCIESGKPIKDARGEVSHLIDTFRYAAEASVRMTGLS